MALASAAEPGRDDRGLNKNELSYYLMIILELVILNAEIIYFSSKL